MSTDFYSLKICLLVSHQKITWVAQFVEIVRPWADHPPCQPTIAAQLLLGGGKIEPYTIIIMVNPQVSPKVTKCTVKVSIDPHFVPAWQLRTKNS
jgi:hypothetical protein